MSSEIGVPRTAVDLSLTDPVEKARAELKAALAAIDDKTNVPRQLSKATDTAILRLRRFSREHPVATVGLAVVKAAAVGALVWWGVNSYVNK